MVLKRRILLAFVAIVSVTAATGVGRALGNTPATATWQASGNPTIRKLTDLPPNVYPSSTNFDCTSMTVKTYGSSGSSTDCMVTVPFGQVGGNGIMFGGSNESIPVVSPFPFSGLQAIPGQSMLTTYSSAAVVGSYMHFYTSIRDKMSSSPQFVNGRWQYTLTKGPDFSLRDANNKLLVVNQFSMAFSPNGNWMVVDLPYQGFVRVNLATFEILPFAASLQQGNDYGDRRAQLSVTNDGRQVVIKPNMFEQLKVYDLSNCHATTMPVPAGIDHCPTRDYWEYVSGQIPGFRGLYQLRFVNDSQISFSAAYEYTPTNFKVASYSLTAPGQAEAGIQYLGLGDSFASGEGAFAYTAETDTANNRCHLSSKSYAHIMTNQLFASGNSVACSGAVIDDILNVGAKYDGQVKDGIEYNKRPESFINSVKANYTPGYLAQSEFLGIYRPQALTLSIGGNNIGFGGIVQSCVSPASTQESCYPTYEDRLELARQINGVFDGLVNTYQTVAKPGKRVYVVGYPQIAASGGDCALNVQLDAHETQFATDLIAYLNIVINRAADKAGVRYVDVSDAFVGHRMCEAKSYDVAVNGFTLGGDSGIGQFRFVGSESYHPNALGHELLAATVRAQTNNLQQLMPTPNPGLQAPALPSSLDRPDLPKSGRSTNTVVAGSGIAPDLLVRNQNVNVVLDAATAALKAFTLYTIVLRSNPTALGTAVTDASGNLTANIQVPSTVPPGFHTLHIYGPNMLGQPLDIVKTVYVAADADDYNGNGITNSMDPCVFLPQSGQDIDKDGIDDACDGYIAAPPAQAAPPGGPRKITSSVTLTGNSVEITLVKP